MCGDQEKNPHYPILMVDDEFHTLQSYEMLLKEEGFNNFISCISSEEAIDVLKEKKVSLVILDLGMRGISGRELLKIISNEYPGSPVIVASAFDNVCMVVECMKNGALDYLVKPIDRIRFITSVRSAIEIKKLNHENALLRQSLLTGNIRDTKPYQKIITNIDSMLSIFRYIDSISLTSQPVLITGETGTGKELIAEAVHKASGRKGKFVSINVAGLDDSTFSDTLFGHKAGSYTDAREARKGLIESANGGTLFLDEIGDLKDGSQIKLLRLIQENEYYPIGSDIPSKANARIVTASNRNLTEMKDKGTFRKDLFYRLNKHNIHLPPLRERIDDIIFLVDFFLKKFSKELELQAPQIPDGLIEILRKHLFPGNIRELEGMIFDAISSPPFGKITLEYFINNLNSCSEKLSSELQSPVQNVHSAAPKIKDAENLLIEKAMEDSDGNLTHAAKQLGISRSTLYRRMSKKK